MVLDQADYVADIIDVHEVQEDEKIAGCEDH